MANEQRLIDANELWHKTFNCDEVAEVRKFIEQAPTVDSVEVVRCKDCKHSIWDEENEMWKCIESAEYDSDFGDYIGWVAYHNADYHCADGERREGE